MTPRFKIACAFIVGFLFIVLFVPLAFAGEPNNRPPENRPPDRGGLNVTNRNNAGAAARSSSRSGAIAVSGGATAEGGSARIDSLTGGNASATGGTGGTATASGGAGGDAFGEGGTGYGGSGGQGGTGGSALSEASSGGNSFDGGSYRTDNDSSFFSLSVGAPNISGCIVGGSVGGGGDGGGGLFQWGRLNHDCFMNEMANAERHIETRARLKCASKHYRNAVTFDFEGKKVERTQACIDYSKNVWAQEINYLRELVDAEIAALEAPGK